MILWLLLTRIPVKVAVTAPSAGQIDSALWPELRKWRNRLPPGFRNLIEITSDRAYVSEAGAEGESFAIARTASKDKPEALQGLHSENMVFLIEEASGVDEVIFDVAASSLSDPNAKIIMTSNPTRTSGYFYDAFHKNAHRWKLMTVAATESSRSAKGALIEEFTSNKENDPNAYRIRVLGEFPTGDSNVLIQRYLAQEAVNRGDKNADNYVAITDDSPIIWGCDVARFGGDSSALAKRQGNTLLEPVLEWHGLDLMQLCGRITNEWNDTVAYKRPSEIYIDVIGMGSGVYDRLHELSGIGEVVKECAVSERAFEPERFMRLRDELWYRAKEWFERRNCRIPYQEKLIVELCTPTYEISSSGKIQVESKKSMKSRGFHSPNLSDAFCISLMNIGSSAKAWSTPLTNPIPDAYWT